MQKDEEVGKVAQATPVVICEPPSRVSGPVLSLSGYISKGARAVHARTNRPSFQGVRTERGP